jgi:hypothetical protein
MPRIVIAALSLIVASLALAYDAQPRRPVSLVGSWVINAAASDDVDKLVAELVERDEKERQRWRNRVTRERPMAELDLPPDSPDAQRRRAAEREWRQMLGAVNKLEIVQEGTKIQIRSEQDVRRFEAGSTSQVSMRNGDLADSKVGWDGEWFVIDRKVPRGARELEKLRWLKKTDQLEYIVQWSGDSELSGVKLRRVFDRASIERSRTNPVVGPVR